ncbi:MAG TPA: hypothetical protein VFC09_06185 [Candidatus Dormibacteraeota bacterium]|nr:hypothetical protein [Candidatus Dormibacteraeota bacterium]
MKKTRRTLAFVTMLLGLSQSAPVSAAGEAAAIGQMDGAVVFSPGFTLLPPHPLDDQAWTFASTSMVGAIDIDGIPSLFSMELTMTGSSIVENISQGVGAVGGNGQASIALAPVTSGNFQVQFSGDYVREGSIMLLAATGTICWEILNQQPCTAEPMVWVSPQVIEFTANPNDPTRVYSALFTGPFGLTGAGA